MMQVTGLPEGTLIDKTDCSSNCYMHGGHLICHDDVISTRRVSYIIYLTDPDEEWKVEDGGALELYPVDSDSVHPTPCFRTPTAYQLNLSVDVIGSCTLGHCKRYIYNVCTEGSFFSSMLFM